MPDLSISQLLIFFVVVGVIFVAVTLITGVAMIEGQDEGIDRRKEPVDYWLFLSIFIMLIAFAVGALMNLNSN
jgi:hypothetical protein